MAGMIRKMARGISRASMAGKVRGAGGPVRAGMHQKAEHEYRRAGMAGGPRPGTAEDAPDLSGGPGVEIPPEEDPETEETAEGTAEIVPDEEILEDIAEDRTEEPETGKVTLAVDYSGERIPDIQPLTVTGSADPRTELVYSQGDGSLKEIQEPLPGMGGKNGVPVKVNDADQVIPVPETEIGFSIDGEGNLIVSQN